MTASVFPWRVFLTVLPVVAQSSLPVPLPRWLCLVTSLVTSFLVTGASRVSSITMPVNFYSMPVKNGVNCRHPRQACQ